MYRWYYESPLGQMTMFGTDSALTALYFSDKNRMTLSPDCPFTEEKTGIFVQTVKYLDTYFKGEIPKEVPSLELDVTPFRLKVLQILQSIGYGKTMTYGDIAQKLVEQYHLKAMSAQAVGNAVGHNPVCIIIPCHRVIGAKGELTGYAGGLERKEQLLKLEGII